MKSLLSISTALFLTTPLVAASHTGSHHQPNSSYHQQVHHHHGDVGPHHHVGHVHHGRHFRHYCFNASWHYWTRRCWCPRYGIYIYWDPTQRCWYRYVDMDQTYVPLDNLTSEYIDGNSVVVE